MPELFRCHPLIMTMSGVEVGLADANAASNEVMPTHGGGHRCVRHRPAWLFCIITVLVVFVFGARHDLLGGERYTLGPSGPNSYVPLSAGKHDVTGQTPSYEETLVFINATIGQQSYREPLAPLNGNAPSQPYQQTWPRSPGAIQPNVYHEDIVLVSWSGTDKMPQVQGRSLPSVSAQQVQGVDSSFDDAAAETAPALSAAAQAGILNRAASQAHPVASH
jgi:hypothetical protein